MDKHRRKGEKPIPDNLGDTLNKSQLFSLPILERFGWELQFVRRSQSSKAVPIVCNTEGTMIGVLEDDGRLNLQVDVQVRDSKIAADAAVNRARMSGK